MADKKKKKYQDFDWKKRDKERSEKIKGTDKKKEESTTPKPEANEAQKLLTQYKNKMSNRKRKGTSTKRKKFWSRFAGIESVT